VKRQLAYFSSVLVLHSMLTHWTFATEPNSNSAPSPQDTGEYRVFDHLWKGTTDLFKGPALVVLEVGTVATLLSLLVENRTYEHFRDHPSSLGETGIFARSFKTETLPITLGVATLAYGHLTGSSDTIGFGQSQMEAQVVYSLSVATIKFITFRNGPRGDALRHAFPSGQAIFVTAGQFAAMYGWAASIPFITLGVVGVVDYTLQTAHWLSDLVFGSFFGIAVGLAFAPHHQHSRDQGTTDRETHPNVFPIVSSEPTTGRQLGLGFRLNF
jgi:hypothetical protein